MALYYKEESFELHHGKMQDVLKEFPENSIDNIICDGGWTIDDDVKIFSELDRLTKLGIKWAYSNVLEIKGKSNNHIKEWALRNNYNIIEFNQKKYSALGKGNAEAQEVFITNYEQKVKKIFYI